MSGSSSGGLSNGGSSTDGSGATRGSGTGAGDGSSGSTPVASQDPSTPPVVGNDPSNGGSSSEGTATVSQLQGAAKSDGQSVHDWRAQNRATIQFLKSARRADRLAFRAISQQLAIEQKFARRVGSTAQSVETVTELSAQMLALRENIRTETDAIATNRHADRVTIHAARKRLAADLRAFHKALYRAVQKKAAA